ncbi:DNA polymerase III subunit gamma and tau [Rothia endophytica]|uniref:DNA polymerase III subunit gamma and tau n=1 Tax=Rothia endophytica TaxID=1324766 RepID=UPI001F000CCA|nr:DNA polymerase III subunit gamma and tau [Rothia endophytica]
MSTALYRRYRPESFADVIGQEHVTEPLSTALEKNRVNHAYLFSGPRGCGKTTSARILARCLNCAEGPTPTPCGQCESCKELSRDGGGSLDVIEMDAASHGGVDHARDLRERATFAPVRDRYKIFIIDEAHMVTREGFNALLKIVEEPPEHIKFIFATTEPNKVLGTIRSRTHHYPFRLVPPETLGTYLQQLCAQENVQVADGVLPLVVRAGGGSVRDSLSILDQLMAGATEGQGIPYDLAVALLGFTHGELLDDVIDAFTSGNAGTVFTAVDRVIQTGQDPRRFVEDLLERFRDLIIVKAVPGSAASILRGMAEDQLERMRAQAEKLGSAELTRAADVTNDALNEMSGAVNPQLHLELLCARILVAATDSSAASLAARLDQLERKLASGTFATPAQGKAPKQQTAEQEPRKVQEAAAPAAATQRAQESAPLKAAPLQQTPQAPAPLASAPLAATPLATGGQTAGEPGAGQHMPPQQAAPQRQTPPQATSRASGENTVDLVANSWNDVLAKIPSAFARAGFEKCEPVRFEQGALFIRAEIAVLRQVKDYLPQLQKALQTVLDLQVQIRGEVKKPGGGTGAPAGGPQPAGDGGTPTPGAPQQAAPIAEGPRGGEQAWASHGQPRSEVPPAWSQDDWNKPVTSWNVAPIPAGSAPAQDGGQGEHPVPSAQGGTEVPREDPNPPTTPHLRVIKGDADPVELAKAHHPSSGGSAERRSMSLAPDVTEDADEEGSDEPTPDTNQVKSEDQAHKNRGTEPTDSAHEGSSQQTVEGSEHAVSTEPVPVSEGLAEAGHQEADNADINQSTSSEPAEQAPGASMQGAPLAHEYAGYEGGYFDDAPEPEPEYVAGVGYVSTDAAAPTGNTAQPDSGLSDRSGPGPAPLAHLAGGTQQQSAAPVAAPGSASGQEKAEKTEKKSGKLSFRERHAAHIAAGQRAVQQQPEKPQEPQAEEDFAPSDEDVALESSTLIGQRAVEKILGGKVIGEQPLHQPS